MNWMKRNLPIIFWTNKFAYRFHSEKITKKNHAAILFASALTAIKWITSAFVKLSANVTAALINEHWQQKIGPRRIGYTTGCGLAAIL